MDWATLPRELLAKIFAFLNCKTLTSAVCVNSTWNNLANYDSIWKEAIFNESFPHPFSYSQKDVPWRQIVQRHFQVKRNIDNRRCVQHTLGVRCPTSKPHTEIVLSHHTANDKYCILDWETLESLSYEYEHEYEHVEHHEHLATELWDLETRTIIQNYESAALELCNEYLLREAFQSGIRSFDDPFELLYSKFDPTQQILFNTITVPNLNYAFVKTVRNEDKNSSLIVLHWSNWSTAQEFINVYDLRTGSKIFEKICSEANHFKNYQFYGDKLLICSGEDSQYELIILDVLKDKETVIKEPQASCATLAGNDLWIVCSKRKCLVKYHLTTMKRQEYEVTVDISNALDMRIYDGLIWLFVRGVQLFFIDVSFAKCRVLTKIELPGWGMPDIRQLPNGAFSCLSSSFAHILSFMDEEIELPIQVLQIEPNGKSEIWHIQQGDLNKKIAECSPTSVSSQIVFEDQSTRYCIIYSYLNKGNPSNDFVDRAKKWRTTSEYHKAAIFQLVQFDTTPSRLRDNSTDSKAFGPCWVIYETKVNGAWQRAAPLDHWTFFKTKLGIK